MHTDTRSERLLRSTLQRSPVPAASSSSSASASPGRRRHSHIPRSHRDHSNDRDHPDLDHDTLSRAAFLYRTTATAATPIRPHNHRSPSSSRPVSPSPSSHRQPLQHSSPSERSLSLQRHNSSPARSRKKPASLAEPLPLTPHEQVLRARLERVLISGRVVDDKERSRERRRSVNPDHDAPAWSWSEKDHHSALASTPPKSSVSGSSDHSHYLYQLPHPQQHHRSRSRTENPLSSPPLVMPSTPRRATTTTIPTYSTTKSPSSQSRHLSTRSPLPLRNNSNASSAGTTPPLTADHSPVFGQLGESMIQHHQHQHIDPDDVRLLTPPPTPPLVGTFTPGSAKHSLYRTRSGEPQCPLSPYSYPHQRGETEGSRVDRLDLGLGVGHPSTMGVTFNARKASEHCRMMEGYVSFANVEGLGTPPDGVDDQDEQEEEKEEDRRGRGIGAIGGWARRLFVGIGNGSTCSGNASTTSTSVA